MRQIAYSTFVYTGGTLFLGSDGGDGTPDYRVATSAPHPRGVSVGTASEAVQGRRTGAAIMRSRGLVGLRMRQFRAVIATLFLAAAVLHGAAARGLSQFADASLPAHAYAKRRLQQDDRHQTSHKNNSATAGMQHTPEAGLVKCSEQLRSNASVRLRLQEPAQSSLRWRRLNACC